MSKMLEAISSLRKTVVEFHNYLCLTKDHTKSWQREPIQIMILNAVSTTRKFDKLSRYVKQQQNNPQEQANLSKKVYDKLIEYIARVQESITGCMLREKNNNHFPYYEFLYDLTIRIDQVLLKPANFCFTYPKKHWLTPEQVVLNLAENMQEYDNPCNNKTVLFRALRWSRYDVTSTTKQIQEIERMELENKVSPKL